MNIKKIIREEMDDFGFINGNMSELHGVSFKAGGFDKPIYTIIDNGHRYYVVVTWTNDAGKTDSITQKRSVVMKQFKMGFWEPIV